MTIRRLSPLIGSLVAVLLLAGCTDDYMHRDRHDEDSHHHDAPAGDRDHQDAHQNDQGDQDHHEGPPR